MCAHAAAAARPTASWSGCPSPRQVAAHQVPGPAVRNIPTSDSVSRSSWLASSPSGKPSDTGGATPKLLWPCVIPIGEWSQAGSGRTVSRRLGRTAVADRNHLDLDAGCDELRGHGAEAERLVVRVCRHDDQPRALRQIQWRQGSAFIGGQPQGRRGAAVGEWLGREPGAVARRRGSHDGLSAGVPRAAQARRDPARRGFAGCRCSGRRPAERAVHPDRAGPVPAHDRCG